MVAKEVQELHNPAFNRVEIDPFIERRVQLFHYVASKTDLHDKRH